MANAARVHAVERGKSLDERTMVALGEQRRCTPPASRRSWGCGG